MDVRFKQQFLALWEKYFPGAELPITYFYTNDRVWAERAKAAAVTQCVVDALDAVRAGGTLALDVETTQCGGGKRYLGFAQKLRPDFEYFLSTGIPGKMEGERCKKSPQLVMEQLRHQPTFEAPGKFIVFKRWDKIEVNEEPLAAIFFAPPDVLSGLFSLANYDQPDANTVMAPSASGCASMVYYSYLESKSDHPRAVLGMFDVTARLCIAPDHLTFSVPMARFIDMVENMDGSFLALPSWGKVRARIKASRS